MTSDQEQPSVKIRPGTSTVPVSTPVSKKNNYKEFSSLKELEINKTQDLHKVLIQIDGNDFLHNHQLFGDGATKPATELIDKMNINNLLNDCDDSDRKIPELTKVNAEVTSQVNRKKLNELIKEHIIKGIDENSGYSWKVRSSEINNINGQMLIRLHCFEQVCKYRRRNNAKKKVTHNVYKRFNCESNCYIKINLISRLITITYSHKHHSPKLLELSSV